MISKSEFSLEGSFNRIRIGPHPDCQYTRCYRAVAVRTPVLTTTSDTHVTTNNIADIDRCATANAADQPYVLLRTESKRPVVLVHVLVIEYRAQTGYAGAPGYISMLRPAITIRIKIRIRISGRIHRKALRRISPVRRNANG